MMRDRQLATVAERTPAIAFHRHFGVPSLGLQPCQIERDDVLLKEIVLRSSVEYAAAKCCADDKPLKPDDMARRFELLLTCEAADPPVLLSTLVQDVRRRADAGSALSICFLRDFDLARRLHPDRDAAVEVIVHGLIAGRPGSPASDFIRRFLGNHRIARAQR